MQIALRYRRFRLVTVNFRMRLCRFSSVMGCVRQMTVSCVCVMSCVFVIAGFMVLCRFPMMARGVFVMLCCLVMMLRCLL